MIGAFLAIVLAFASQMQVLPLPVPTDTTGGGPIRSTANAGQ